jgi:outer membrane protein OmpA-like peptidoglycan-associated protein
LLANDALSLKRAKVVSQLLVDKGAVAARVEAVGRGKRELLVPTADEVDEPQNRRVEIVVR